MTYFVESVDCNEVMPSMIVSRRISGVVGNHLHSSLKWLWKFCICRLIYTGMRIKFISGRYIAYEATHSIPSSLFLCSCQVGLVGACGINHDRNGALMYYTTVPQKRSRGLYQEYVPLPLNGLQGAKDRVVCEHAA